MAIHLQREQIELIRGAAERGYPEEVCGFVYGREHGERREISEVVPVVNEQDHNRARRFLVTPQQFRDAEAHALRTGTELLGIYHSHPDHPAEPSEFDREHAWPFYSYLIISVRAGRGAELRSWLLREDRSGYNEEAIAQSAPATL